MLVSFCPSEIKIICIKLPMVVAVVPLWLKSDHERAVTCTKGPLKFSKRGQTRTWEVITALAMKYKAPISETHVHIYTGTLPLNFIIIFDINDKRHCRTRIHKMSNSNMMLQSNCRLTGPEQAPLIFGETGLPKSTDWPIGRPFRQDKKHWSQRTRSCVCEE